MVQSWTAWMETLVQRMQNVVPVVLDLAQTHQCSHCLFGDVCDGRETSLQCGKQGTFRQCGEQGTHFDEGFLVCIKLSNNTFATATLLGSKGWSICAELHAPECVALDVKHLWPAFVGELRDPLLVVVKHVAFVLLQEPGMMLAVFVSRGNRMWSVCWLPWQRCCSAGTVSSNIVMLAEKLHCTVER